MMEFGLPYIVKLQGSVRSYMMEFGLPYLVKLQGSLRSSMLDFGHSDLLKVAGKCSTAANGYLLRKLKCLFKLSFTSSDISNTHFSPTHTCDKKPPPRSTAYNGKEKPSFKMKNGSFSSANLTDKC
ncbi:uncharacterized protein [Solanum lycopersicum]|uniref:uncharacterized protein isoform X3 n=1 Tax=Solanum lycopersicum TaxID=4081 RepID=UPI000532C5BA|nr:uncharacterized protein LOC104649657 isoform X3 [Solanum lycopersicum]